MKPNLLARIVAPVIAISALPLIVGVVSAWRVHTSQKKASNAWPKTLWASRRGEPGDRNP